MNIYMSWQISYAAYNFKNQVSQSAKMGFLFELQVHCRLTLCFSQSHSTQLSCSIHTSLLAHHNRQKQEDVCTDFETIPLELIHHFYSHICAPGKSRDHNQLKKLGKYDPAMYWEKRRFGTINVESSSLVRSQAYRASLN